MKTINMKAKISNNIFKMKNIQIRNIILNRWIKKNFIKHKKNNLSMNNKRINLFQWYKIISTINEKNIRYIISQYLQ